MPSTRAVRAETTEYTKDRILRVAAELFMRQGYSGTSVREIGQRAGISQSALYHHIQSKAHLLKALHQQFIVEMIDRLETVVDTDRSAPEKLRDIVGVVMSIIESHQPEVTVFLREQHALPPAMRRSIVRQRDRVDQLVDRVIRDGMAAGELRSDVDVRLIRLGILGMCNWAYQWFRSGERFSSEEIAAAFGVIAIEGIVEPEPRGR
ncbi:TetR/AcrR family transcriptional regulator [Actinophytocola sp.]|uniref:TetR/AcrR family transcriptional regulator n=1 Tax=Actinophytocola sp. TaxID=1872138 RepID=UPI003D6A00BF